MLKIDAAVIIVRNRLPGQDIAGWRQEISALGQGFARAVLGVHLGEVPEGQVSVEDLLYAGMTEDLATGLLPLMTGGEGFVERWRQLEGVVRAARQLASPTVLAALPEPEPASGPRYIEGLGPLRDVLFGPRFVTLQEALARLPRAGEFLQARMASLCALHAMGEAMSVLRGSGWTPVEHKDLITETVLLHPGIGILVMASDASTRRTVQRTLDLLAELGAPLLDGILQDGGRPVTVVNQSFDDGHVGWALDGEDQPPGVGPAEAIPAPPGALSGRIRSLVGQVHAGLTGIASPGWATCPSCGSVRVEAARLELQWGRASLLVDPQQGEFSSAHLAWLRLSSRQNDRKTVLTRILRCPDCFEARPFPGEDWIPGASLPRRMAGEKPPRGIAEVLSHLTGLQNPLPEVRLPAGIESWLQEQEPGAPAQFSDQRLVFRSAFRLPDNLVDLARSLPENRAEADQVWRDSVGRVGRGAESVLAWELRDMADDSGRRIVVLGIDPDHASNMAQNWFGPVDEWIEVSPRTCWRGVLVGSEGRVELMLIHDFLGAPGPFTGDGVDYQVLEGLIRRARAVVYAGDGTEAWDDDGVQWASDEGPLCAVVAPAAQLTKVTDPGDAVLIDADQPSATGLLRKAVDARVDPQTLLVLREVRRFMDAVEASLPVHDMEDFLVSGVLRRRAVEAQLHDTSEGWLYLFDGVLEALVEEAGGREGAQLRSSLAARRLQELGFSAPVVQNLWHLLEFHERTGFGAPLVRWLQPILRDTPDRIHLARVRAVARRMPDLAGKFTELHTARGEVLAGKNIRLRRKVLTFWWGVAAPGYWPAGPTCLPDLLGLAPSGVRKRSTILVGGGPRFAGRRIARLIAGLEAPMEEDVPRPGLGTSVIVQEPQNLSYVRLEARSRARNLTVLVTGSRVERWREVLPPDLVATVVMTPEMTAECPTIDRVMARFPALTPISLEELAGLMHVVSMPAGTRILEPGLRVGCIGWIRSGSVKLDDGVLLGPGEIVGAHSLLRPAPVALGAVARDAVELELLSHSAFHALEDGRRAVVPLIQRQACTQLARLLADRKGGAGAVKRRSAGLRRSPSDWRLMWPMLKRRGFGHVDPDEVQSLFPGLWVGTAKEGTVLYSTGSESPELLLLLDGQLQVDDARGAHKLRPGSFVGNLGLLDHVATETCTALVPSTLLVLGSEPDGVWTTKTAAYRQAMIDTLCSRWGD